MKHNKISGFGPKGPINQSSNTNRWTGDFATGRIFGPTDANNPQIIGFNQRDFRFIIEAINEALRKRSKPLHRVSRNVDSNTAKP